MAKRRRLTPPRPELLAESPEQAAPEVKSAFPFRARPDVRPPIAQVAGEAAAEAALGEVSREMVRAREEGRIVESLPLAEIDPEYLIRDRAVSDPEEMEVLLSSLRSRGQQAPVEVVDLGRGTHPRYGLISGWRRVTALRHLADEAGQGEAVVLALVRRPETAAEAYVAMVEENEIRADISFYERARIVVKALEQGVYPDAKSALQGLFGNVSRAKRSKIKSFMTLVRAFDGALRFPEAISEKTGLALVKRVDLAPERIDRAVAALREHSPAAAEEEIHVLFEALAEDRPAPEPVAKSSDDPELRGLSVFYEPEKNRILISGAKVDAALARALRAWLAER